MEIAVIGMGCRFPEADTVDEFWENLISGKNSITKSPLERWWTGGQTDLMAGYLKCPLDEFDANFFNISPKEATYIDPQHRLFLEVSWESLEHAGIPPTSLNGTKTGVYLGIGSDEYFRTQLDAREDTVYKIVGNSISAATGRLSFFLNLLGPSFPIEATCASSAVAIHLACAGLRAGECTLALAGGVNLVIDADSTYPSALISPSCRSFDSSASGFAPAEGCGVIVLKPLSEAIRDKNTVLGVIRGSYLNHTGRSNSYGTPRADSEELVIRQALKAARVDPREVSYVEAHAGGTAIGDPIEVKAISNVFGSHDRHSPLVLGAFKSNIGHPMAAAGVAGVIKMLLCFQHKMIPPNLHLTQLHPDINLHSIPAVFPTTPVPWDSANNRLIGAINCFGITGTNVHLVLQQAPIEKSKPIQADRLTKKLQLVTISAKDEIALEKLRSKYKNALELMAAKNLSLNDFSFSANTAKSHMSHRVAVLGSTCAEVADKIGRFNYISGTVQSIKQHIVFLFTGHGCHYYGMAKNLYETSAVFREAFDACSIVYRNNLGIRVEDFIWNQNSNHNLNRTKYCQPAIFVIEVCLYRLWSELGVRPDFVLGHSIGEFAACVAAGILSFEDGMKLVCCRSILIDSLEEGRMIAVGANVQKVTDLIIAFNQANPTAWVDLACLNSVDQCVLSMEPETAETFKVFLDGQQPAIKSKVLSSSHAFHSRSMDHILNEFGQIAAEVEVRQPTCKYVSGMLARELQTGDINATYWKNHCRNAVSFSNGLDLLLAKGCKVFLEVSPQPILLNFLMSNNVNGAELVSCQSLRNQQDPWTTLLTSVAKIYVSTNAEINFNHLNHSGKRILLPHYPFNRKKCWAVAHSSGCRGLAGPNVKNAPQLHSLLGWKLNLPMSNELRYCNYISAGSTGYVHDHVIVDHVIIPAACYVEMLLAIARLELGIKYPLIENLTVLRACVLDETMKQIQIKAEYNGPNLVVTFYSETENGEWMLHVQATLNIQSAPVTAPKPLDAEEMQRIQTECSEELDVSAMYERLDESGVSMGLQFRSARKLCMNPEKTAMVGSIDSVKTVEGEFSMHPITIDALVQCFWEYKMCRLDEVPFALPVGINKFIWYGGDNAWISGDVYFYLKDEDHGIMFTADGQVLGEIEVLTVLHSTTMAFLRSIAPGEKLPQFITKGWVPLPGYTLLPENSTELNCDDDGSTQDEIGTAIETLKTLQKEQAALEKSYDTLTYLYILRALLLLGWNPDTNQAFRTESVVPTLSSTVDARVYVNFFSILTANGLLSKSGSEEWVLQKVLPSIEAVSKEIDKLEIESENSVDFNYIKRAGASLPSILQGQDPLEALSTSGLRKSEDSVRVKSDAKILETALFPVVKRCFDAGQTKKLRVLQIGATTRDAVVSVLEAVCVTFELTFADVGVNLKSDKDQPLDSRIKLKPLDIQKDPKCQGFQPNNYDIVVAIQTLHITENLKAALENVRHLLRPNGYFLLCELVQEYTDFALTYCLSKNYWRLKDLRGEVIPCQQGWTQWLTQAGFVDTVNSTLPDYPRGLIVSRPGEDLSYRPFLAHLSAKDPAWLIFGSESALEDGLGRKLKFVGRNAFYVTEGQRFDKVNDSFTLNSKRSSDFQQLSHVLKNYDIEGILYLWGLTATETTTTAELKRIQETITMGFLNVLKMKINNSWTSKIVLVTSGAEEVNPSQGTLWGMLDTFFNEYPEATGIGIDIDDPSAEDDSVRFVFSLLWDTPYERGVRFQQGAAELARLHGFDSAIPLNEVILPKSNQFRLTDPLSLTFGPVESAENVNRLEVAVRAVGLNFRDLLLCNGLLETPYPDSVGLEFAGVVTRSGNSARFKIGDRVAGLTCSGSFASHVTTANFELLYRIPEGMCYTGAATMPCAFGTCYLSLVEIAKVKPGEKVLIHTASGGVGLAGIQLARYLGADLYVTAGTPKKRNYLKHCVGLTHIYSSRTHDYRDAILRDTGGSGVDVIINTITGLGFKEASLACLGKAGRFIELSKLNVWNSAEVAVLRPDVQYTILDAFDMIMKLDPSLTRGLAQLSKLFTSNAVDILPHTDFPLGQLKSAFKYFHAHNHIGKVVVEIPGSVDKLSTLTLYNDQSTVLVTGGIGGLGFEVGQYLWRNGANVLLVGRSQEGEEMQGKIASFGDRMRYVQCDIGDYEKTKELLDSTEPPLRGIFHCAGVFANGFLVGQNAENYAKSFQSKVYGTWNLHLLTKNRHLDHFVVFSSVAAVFGSTGLSNYSAGNRFLDSLVHYRVNQCGLPGLTIDWGPWAEIGAAAGYVAGMFKNFQHFSPDLGIQSMERAMRLRLNDIAIADMDMNIVLSSPRLGPYLSELSVDTGGARRRNRSELGMNRPSDIRVANLAKEVIAATDAQSRLEKMETFVEAMFRSQSGLSETDVIDKDQALTLMGMDSLIGMEMRLTISKLLDVQISANGVMEHNSIRMFSLYLVSLLSPEDQTGRPSDVVSSEVVVAEQVTTPVEEALGDNKMDMANDIVLFEKPRKQYKSSLPKFVAKRLQKFHNSEKKLSKKEKLLTGTTTV